MTTLSSLKTRLSIELGDSESVNKTDPQRTQAINDSLRQIYEYRNWPQLYVNKDIQGVDGILNIPRNMDKPVILWYGQNTDYYWEYDFTNQTDFFTKSPYSLTITDYNGRQVIQMSEDQNRGHDVYNYTGTSTIGINDVSARSQVGQTFTATDSTLYGTLLKLSIEGAPEGTLTIDIKATAGGLPTGSSLATGTLNINEITAAEEYFWVKFTSSVTLTEDSTYSITVTPSYSTDASNYVKWTYSTTSQITGSQVLYDGGNWSLGAGDQVFVLCSNYYKFQYLQKFIDLEDPTDDSGLPSEFDQAICKNAAGIILTTKQRLDKAQICLYGIGGSQQAPTLNSAFGLLNQIWTRVSENAIRNNRRLKSVFEKRSNLRRRYENYYNPNV